MSQLHVFFFDEKGAVWWLRIYLKMHILIYLGCTFWYPRLCFIPKIRIIQLKFEFWSCCIWKVISIPHWKDTEAFLLGIYLKGKFILAKDNVLSHTFFNLFGRNTANITGVFYPQSSTRSCSCTKGRRQEHGKNSASPEIARNSAFKPCTHSYSL